MRSIETGCVTLARAETGDKQDRSLSQVLGQIGGRAHVLAILWRQSGLGIISFRTAPAAQIDLGNLFLYLLFGDHHKAPGLHTAPTRPLSTGLNHFVNQLERHRVGLESAHTPTRIHDVKQIGLDHNVLFFSLSLTEHSYSLERALGYARLSNGSGLGTISTKEGLV